MVREKFGRYGKEFYSKVFDLLLRLKVRRAHHALSCYLPFYKLTVYIQGKFHVACHVAWLS